MKKILFVAVPKKRGGKKRHYRAIKKEFALEQLKRDEDDPLSFKIRKATPKEELEYLDGSHDLFHSYERCSA